MAMANLSAAKILVTPPKVSLWLSLSRERSMSSSFTLQKKKKSAARANPGELANAEEARCLCFFLATAVMGTGALSQWKTTPPVGVAKIG